MAFETDLNKELENYKKRCLELEKKSETDDMNCLMLQIEVEDLKKKNEELEAKVMKSQEGVELMNDKNEGDKLDNLMIENSCLEVEKQKAEAEVFSSRDKVNELMSRVCELESNLKDVNENAKEDVNVVSRLSSKVRKRLPFEEEKGCSNKKMASCAPGATGTSFIDISDEDVSRNEIPKDKSISDSGNYVEEDDMEYVVPSSRSRISKRKRPANRIPSDDEISDEDDDDAPISTLMTRRPPRIKKDFEDEVNEDASKRPLMRLRKLKSKNNDESGRNLNETICLDENTSGEDEDEIEEGSGSEGESSDNFIDDSPIDDSSESVSECSSKSGDSCDESEDPLNDYKATLDMIGRKKVLKLNWDLEGDMLADFGKDPKLCMRAICVLYRQQTADEKESKEAIHHNKRGFSKPDARRASKLAYFLTDGDSKGDLNKTVEELKQYDSNGIEFCTKLAKKYSKQLFEIYQKKEDPYFMPQ